MKSLAVILSIIALFSCQGSKTDQRIDSIDKFVNGQADHFKFNGSVLVAEKGKVVYQKCFGVSNYGTQQKLNDSSLFELASVSKQFTATAILLLKEKGLLRLTDSLRAYFPSLPYSGITIRHMLTHTSGLPDYESTMAGKWDPTKIAYNNDVIDFLSKEKPPIHFKPGERWEYSNTGFVLLASIVEKVSGQSFREFMAKNLFGPLGMKSSRVYNTRREGEVIPNYAYGYVWSDSLRTFMLPDSVPDLKFVYWLDGIQGDGIINSTAIDLLKWDRSMVAHTLLSEETISEMVSPHALMDTALNYHYGYGVMVGENELGKFVTHSGGWPGYATNLSRYVDQDYTIIVLSNNQSASPAISGTIAHILFNDPVIDPHEHKSISLDSASLNDFVGSFKVKGKQVDIVLDGDGLAKVYKSGQRVKLQPESSSIVYTTDGYDVHYEIEKPADGKIRYYEILYGVRQEMEKLN